MNLSDLADVVEILGVLALIFGIWFGLIQLKHNRRQRRDLSLLECARSFEDQDFTEAYRLLCALPHGISKARFDELGEEHVCAAMRIGMKFETVGLLVHRGVIDVDAMDDLVGGAALKVWHVIEQWVMETRIVTSHPRFWEWYQWLVERLEERGRADKEPAFVTQTHWKERNT